MIIEKLWCPGSNRERSNYLCEITVEKLLKFYFEKLTFIWLNVGKLKPFLIKKARKGKL